MEPSQPPTPAERLSASHAVAIAAPPERVWAALTEPRQMAAWMGEPEMGLTVELDGRLGGAMVTRGVHHRPFVNRGEVVAWDPPRRLAYTHLSSISRAGAAAGPALLSFTVAPAPEGAHLTVDVSAPEAAAIFKHLDFYWRGTLQVLRDHVEGG